MDIKTESFLGLQIYWSSWIQLVRIKKLVLFILD